MKLTFLGTGTSHGVPAIDCMMNDYVKCPQDVCRASAQDPKHARLRSSLLVQSNGHNILIDTSLDFRMQMLLNKVSRLDAVLLTHAHEDHIGGLPDIRSYCKNGQALPVYGSMTTIENLRQRFSYIFDPPDMLGGGIPVLDPRIVDNGQTFELLGLEITAAEVVHGSLKGCFGYRIGNIGYISDIKSMPKEALHIFKDLEILILNALRRAPEHSTHLTLEQSVNLARRLNPKSCYFIHMSHDIHYQQDQKFLPHGMTFAYDGQSVEV